MPLIVYNDDEAWLDVISGPILLIERKLLRFSLRADLLEHGAFPIDTLPTWAQPNALVRLATSRQSSSAKNTSSRTSLMGRPSARP